MRVEAVWVYPVMQFNELDDEVLGDDADDIAAAVDDWEARVRLLEDLRQGIDSDDSFHSHHVVRHDLESRDIPLALGTVVPEQWDLLRTQCSLVQ